MRTSPRRRPQLLTVRGYMRSGTNWVGNLLNQHPDITCLGEFHWHRMFEAFAELPLVGSGKPHHELAKAHVQEAVRRTIEDACRSRSRRRVKWVGDRTPTEIDLQLYPNAHHVVIVRDLRDVVVSRAFHLFSRPHIAENIFRDPATAARLAEYQRNSHFFRENPEELLASDAIVRYTVTAWARHVRADEDTIRRNPQAPILRLRYEDLHRSTEAERRRMFVFLGVDPGRAPELGGKTSAGFSFEQPAGILRKGAVGEWRTYFTAETHRLVGEEAGDVMTQLGYDLTDTSKGTH